MTSLAFNRRSSAQESLASEIHACIAQYLKVDADSFSASSHLTDDLGLDLLDITDVMIVLEEKFGAERKIAAEPNQIEFVRDLIRYVDGNKSS
jgi:acyl carrier protein